MSVPSYAAFNLNAQCRITYTLGGRAPPNLDANNRFLGAEGGNVLLLAFSLRTKNILLGGTKYHSILLSAPNFFQGSRLPVVGTSGLLLGLYQASPLPFLVVDKNLWTSHHPNTPQHRRTTNPLTQYLSFLPYSSTPHIFRTKGKDGRSGERHTGGFCGLLPAIIRLRPIPAPSMTASRMPQLMAEFLAAFQPPRAARAPPVEKPAMTCSARG